MNSWFSELNAYPIWLQILIAWPICSAMVMVIALCLVGIGQLFELLHELIRR